MRRLAAQVTAIAVAMACMGAAGETITVAAGETLELDLRESQVTNAADSVITLGAGATLKLVESTPSSTATPTRLRSLPGTATSACAPISIGT